MKEQFESLNESKFKTFENAQVLDASKIRGGTTVIMSSRSSGSYDTAEQSATPSGSSWDDTQWHASGTYTACSWANVQSDYHQQ
jgi:hypothetical protein